MSERFKGLTFIPFIFIRTIVWHVNCILQDKIIFFLQCRLQALGSFLRMLSWFFDKQAFHILPVVELSIHHI